MVLRISRWRHTAERKVHLRAERLCRSLHLLPPWGLHAGKLYRNRREEANSRTGREAQRELLQKSAEGRVKIANTPDSTSKSERDKFCRLTRNRCGRREGSCAVNEPGAKN